MFLLDIGNTHTRLAESSGAEIRIIGTVATADLTLDSLPLTGDIAAASVDPSASGRLSGRGINFITADNCGKLVDFSTYRGVIGADRVANVIAAAEFYELPALVIDCGSAITCEMVDDCRRFRGGAIAPGRMLMRNALGNGTAQLPDVEISSKLPETPGLGTVDAIRWGVDGGALGIIRELSERFSRELDFRSVILTGGDAGFFAEFFPDWQIAPDDFTLQGIRLAAEG